ncbi:MBOAT family protein [uncultured Gemmiger sp.]|uniref:MBOAT family O-acyltransferase n=1 Tax=uncultured Gemmiger sp. TaxID=1623490 RepID=UPI00266EFBAA|nr:MBOAT family O-acyltransferase [uncultured Gemmiger sp.]
MVFSSAIFLFAFLPIVLLLYCLSGQRLKNGILLAASLLFYAYGEPKFVFVMLASIVLNYAFAMLIELPGYGSKRWRRDWLLAALTCNLGILFVFKYLNFFGHMVGKALHIDLQLPSIALPIGISFFTFQALSYVVDVYRGTTRVQRNPFSLALYISFFPQLIAGPIVRYSTIAEQIDDRKVTPEKLSQGVQRFIAGFCKKVLLANNVALVAEAAFDVHGEKSVALLWVGSLAYTLQIFFDFCGYSDMAIGLGKMFGFEFEENFNYPYMAKSVTDFWHRWHISLSQWFRDYVYFPLGGSRVTPARHIFNLFVVWFLTGLWHGANYTFLAWGMMYFVMQLVEKFLVKPQRLNGATAMGWRVVTLLIVNFGWVLFNSLSIADAKQYIFGMLGLRGLPLWSAAVTGSFREYGVFLLLGVMFSTPITKVCGQRLCLGRTGTAWQKVLLPLGQIAVFAWAVSFVVLGAHNPFIYFNF